MDLGNAPRYRLCAKRGALILLSGRDPQVGNGIQFTRMLPEDIDELREFMAAAESEAAHAAGKDSEPASGTAGLGGK